MDSILKSNRILDSRSWLFLKLYKNPATPTDWKNSLNWYHQALVNVVRPVVNGNAGVAVVFFGFYGPEAYEVCGEKYQKKIGVPNSQIMLIRLRVAVKDGKKKSVRNAFLTLINSNRNLVWDYETMVTYNVTNDLGARYGSNQAVQTLGFIRYWDAACRYILSILTTTGNWLNDVDVWGVPHMVNNSLGAWLRPERPSQPCPNCQTHMYLNTVPLPLTFSAPITQIDLPSFVFICPNCQNKLIRSSNI
jgi:hypothetical protein